MRGHIGRCGEKAVFMRRNKGILYGMVTIVNSVCDIYVYIYVKDGDLK